MYIKSSFFIVSHAFIDKFCWFFFQHERDDKNINLVTQMKQNHQELSEILRKQCLKQSGDATCHARVTRVSGEATVSSHLLLSSTAPPSLTTTSLQPLQAAETLSMDHRWQEMENMCRKMGGKWGNGTWVSHRPVLLVDG